ncbi:MAG: acetyl-CoA carboxylase, carboxyltransferase subunit beta [Eubacterium sp.]|nr:acetyl-CoA carboxylase, carboxyltransferase subunit beta [Eubacterium sp.]
MLIKKNKEKVAAPNFPKDVPDGLLRKCRKCKSVVLAKNVKEAGYICPKCGGYFRVHAKRRIEMIGDEGSFESWFEGMKVEDVLEFPGYVEKVEELRNRTGLDEAVTCGELAIEGQSAAVAVMDGRFLMGSMGKIVGEKITRTVERATERNLPVIIFSCSGGARMQEGIVSLMQMAKTSAALKRHHESGNLYISVLTDPTTGGVTASFAMLGDIILAEPKALIGFAGPRVIEQTIGQKLPKGFQRSEYLLEHGFVDRIVERENLKQTLAEILRMHQKSSLSFQEEVKKSPSIKKKDGGLTPWERVQISRKKDRPVAEDYIKKLFSNFYEFHGDRNFGDDPSILGGIALFHGIPVTVIAQAKGHNTKENIYRNFGMPNPEGYRKALRLMKQAEKFHRPIFCIVDTPGAFCGIEAEQRGQGEAIARNLFEMSALKTPVVTLIIGEGGSGGALAMAVSDEVWMMENSVYSILSPEGYASILLKDGKLAEKSANMMKMTSMDLLAMKMVEKVFEEPENYIENTMGRVIEKIDWELIRFIEQSSQWSEEEIVKQRYERFRAM